MGAQVWCEDQETKGEGEMTIILIIILILLIFGGGWRYSRPNVGLYDPGGVLFLILIIAVIVVLLRGF